MGICTGTTHAACISADANILMDGLKDFLPKNRDRTPAARKAIAADKSASFDQKVHAYLEKNPPVHKVDLGKPGEGATYPEQLAFYKRYARAAMNGGWLDKINPMALYYAAAANFGWGDPKGSVGEKLIDDLWKQFVDFQRIEKLGLPKVQPQNAPFTR